MARYSTLRVNSTELRLIDPLYTKQVISEMPFPANLLACLVLRNTINSSRNNYRKYTIKPSKYKYQNYNYKSCTSNAMV